MKLQTRSRSRARKVSKELRAKVDELLKQESRFIYTPEFETIGDDPTPIQQAEDLLHQLQSIAINGDPNAEIPSGMDLDEVVSLRNWSSPDPLLTFEDEQILFRAMNLLRFRVNQKRARLSAKIPSDRLIIEIDSMLDLVNRIRTQLVNSNLRLVSSIARKFASSGCDVDDFSSDGCMILLGAIDRFDYSRGFRFSTYATHSIQRHFFRAW
ncbi:MAG: hypothetical protein KDA77_21710, partial [Planctomycetaceae bacterium]|nr:hypothetical protein [Planctomycetaceae bacterium]